MRIIKKTISDSGRVHVYVFGIKIISYRIKNYHIQNDCRIHGVGNDVVVGKHSTPELNIYGDNNRVRIDSVGGGLAVHLGFGTGECNNCSVSVGAGTTFVSADIRVREDNVNISIGEDCQFSEKIFIWASDTHTITDMDGNVTNFGKYVTIGNHVWVGYGATICKNTKIADGCIIGTGAVVSGTFDKPNCVIAGNPARVVKENAKWDRRPIQNYIASVKNKSVTSGN